MSLNARRHFKNNNKIASFQRPSEGIMQICQALIYEI